MSQLPILSILVALPLVAGVLALFQSASGARWNALITTLVTLALGRFFWKRGDEQTIDRFGPHGAAYAVGIGNRITTRFQSGYVYSYALVMLLGLIGAATWVFWWVR